MPVDDGWRKDNHFFSDVTTEVAPFQCMNSRCGISGLKNMNLRGKSSEDIVKESEEREWCLDLIKTYCIHYGIFNNKVITKSI